MTTLRSSTRVEELVRQIALLNQDELTQLCDWFMKRDSAPQLHGDSATKASIDPLNVLREEFDRELDVLQLAGASETLLKVFASTPAEIAEAMNAGARRKL
jgi:hypothetical protein